MLDAGFRNGIFDFYREDRALAGIEKDFDAAKLRLSGLLSPEQSSALDELEPAIRSALTITTLNPVRKLFPRPSQPSWKANPLKM